MAEHTDPLQVMSEERARELLRSQRVGRMVQRIGDIIEIFPLNYGTDGERILVRTAPGTKLAGMFAATELLFEIDVVTEHHVWSVIARGTARLVETEAERAEFAEIMPQPLLPTVKEALVEFRIDSLTGREFTPGAEPEIEPETIA